MLAIETREPKSNVGELVGEQAEAGDTCGPNPTSRFEVQQIDLECVAGSAPSTAIGPFT